MFDDVVKKWEERWEKEGKYEANKGKGKKFFVNFPYPYINGYLHLGHLYSMMKVEVLARFMRMLGYNVLFPQAFHATGQPIVAAAERVREGEEKQIAILKMMGIKDKDIEKFKDPKYWIAFFSLAAKEDLKRVGMSIDWRRSFITTSLNPAYDKFIKWQYTKLMEAGVIEKGKHAVVYCPKCKHAIGDHDRLEGEGVVPEKVVLIKFKLEGNKYLVAMTFRPETIYGVTNVWVNKDGEYVEFETEGKEVWIISKEMVEVLRNQGIEGKVKGEIKGEKLIRKEVEEPINKRKVKVLHADFVDMDKGTGIVMSVPAHAPYDYIEYREVKDKEKLPEMISLISLPGYGAFPAKDICEKKNIKSVKERGKLDEATKEIYKKEYHQGKLKDIVKGFAGMNVREAKDKIVEMLVNKGWGREIYILPEKVVCRCLTPAIVKIIEDQWFLKYSDKKWKEKAHKSIDKMLLYPPHLKDVFHKTIDWLSDWAFTRERGLGSEFPYDKGKLIESLSDSTIYMAYYTIAKYLENKEKYNIDIEKIDNDFFDYVFLGKGNEKEIAKKTKIKPKLLKEIREEFEYWYDGGFDLRNSGKDLIRNHLAMAIFHHTAIFPEKNWIGGIGVNGHILIDGEKMSKSKGNFYTIRDAIKRYGIVELRFALAFAGNVGEEDANLDTKLMQDIGYKLKAFMEFAKEHYNKGESKKRRIDVWFLAKISELRDKAIEEYKKINTREALQHAFFDMQRVFKWYHRRTLGKYNKEVINNFIETQLLLLTPVVPHYTQEVWESIGKRTYIIDERIDKGKDKGGRKKKEEKKVEELEEYLQNTIEDIHEILSIVKKEPKEIKLYVAEEWKYKAMEMLREMLKGEKYSKGIENKYFNDSIKYLMQDEEMKKRSKEIIKIIKPLIRSALLPFHFSQQEEKEFLEENKEFLEKELKVNVKVIYKEEHAEEKGKKSVPFKPGIEVVV